VTPALFTSGGLILDNVVTAEGALIRGQIGGNALYSAAGAALWRDKVGVIGRVPAGYPLDRIAAAHDGRIDLSAVRREAAQVVAEEWFFYEPDGERRDQLHATAAEADAAGMVGAHVAPEQARAFAESLAGRSMEGLSFGGFRAAHPVTPAQLPKTIAQARALHLAPNAPAAQLALAQAARQAGLLVSCDPGHFAREMDDAYLDRLLPLLDAFLPSAREAALLRPGWKPEAAALDLARRTRRLAGVKLGAGGAVLACADGRVLRVTAAPAAAVDPTGAGDAWCGGVLAGLTQGDTLETAARRAAVTAAICVELRGPLALMSHSRAEAGRRLAASPVAVTPLTANDPAAREPAATWQPAPPLT
jgi:ribokinase